MDVSIKIVDQATPNIAAGIRRLLPQLLSKEKEFTVLDLEGLLQHENVYLFVAMLGDDVVGTAQLSTYPRAYGVMAWVDGVIVDSEVRGKGIATTLMEAVLAHARTLNLTELNLTSSPKREAANHLYQKLGFEQHETNYYRYKF
jgi:GNAT superfamily N-acetyltransferase